MGFFVGDTSFRWETETSPPPFTSHDIAQRILLLFFPWIHPCYFLAVAPGREGLGVLGTALFATCSLDM